MQLKNSTTWSDKFLRRMVSWCCKKIEMPARLITRAQFTNCYNSYRGRAFGRRFLVRIGPAERYPTRPDTRPGMGNEVFADRVEALVAVTAHELYHCAADCHPDHQQRTRRRNSFGSSERLTHVMEVKVLRAFRANREALLAAWSADDAKPAKAKSNVVEKRAAKAMIDLSRWERKLKLAKTKVAKCRQRVRYYERRQAATKSGDGDENQTHVEKTIGS